MELFSSFIKQLSDNLKKPLPGEAAHQTMEALSASYLCTKSSEQTRRSAVLMLLYPCGNEVCLPLILRTSNDSIHSGQIAFPGGRYELEDENLIQTALRETHEEIGLKPDEIKILGTLTEIFIAPSNFLVLPVVGYIPYRPDFLPNAQEVEAIFETKLNHFLNPAIVASSEIPIPGERVLTPHYEVNGHKVWGATAKMIAELLLVQGASVSVQPD